MYQHNTKEKNFKYLCLDLGTTTGWAICNENDSILSGNIKFKSDRFEGGGMRFYRFRNWLFQIAKNHAPFDAVFFEEVRNHKGVDAAHCYGGFLGILSEWCEKHQIPYKGVPVGLIKKNLTGKGNASKKDMINHVKERGYNPEDDNEADAIAIALCALNQDS